MSVAVTYLHNLRHDFERWTKGCRPGDELVVVTSRVFVGDPTPEIAAELAFMSFQRGDDEHPQLDREQAPSMSIGDVALVQAEPGDPGVALAVRFYNFERLTDEDRDSLIVVPRGSRTVAEMVQATR